MNGYLKQSTASQSRLIGPFISDTDFKTAQTALTIANTDVKLRANGTTLSNKNSGGGTHQVNGMYSLTWDATDTANVGELYFSVSVAGALQVFGSYCVLEEAVYDALFAASAPGYLQPTTAGRTLDVSTTGEAGVDWANVGSPTTTVGLTGTTISTTQAVASVTGAVGSVGAGGITASTIATGAIDADALAADAVDEILDEVVEGTTTLRQMLRGFASALLSKVSGAGTTTIVFRDVADSKNRITATVDSSGNRSAITLDLT